LKQRASDDQVEGNNDLERKLVERDDMLRKQKQDMEGSVAELDRQIELTHKLSSDVRAQLAMNRPADSALSEYEEAMRTQNKQDLDIIERQLYANTPMVAIKKKDRKF